MKLNRSQKIAAAIGVAIGTQLLILPTFLKTAIEERKLGGEQVMSWAPMPAAIAADADSADTGPSDGPNKIHKHAIITPYRNRPYHYETFVEFMDQYLQQHFNQSNTQFSLWVIEQDDDEPFNRGWLANVGLAEIFKAEPDTECITFHDIDLIPDTNDSHGGAKVIKGPVDYNKCERPMQIGSELSHFKWGVPYKSYAGGITTLHMKHWKQINGFSNDYIGWGGEDDDHFHRLRLNQLLDPTTGAMARPPKGNGRFRTISQESQHHGRAVRDETNYGITLKILRQMAKNSPRWKYDGLTDLQYIVASRDDDENDHTGGGFRHIHHVKARQQLLEFVHIPKTAGSSIEVAAAKAGIPWGACHFHHALNKEMGCPDPPNFQHLGLDSTVPALRSAPIWHVPPHRWNIDLFYSKKTFTVVRNPYSLAVSIYYDKWVGYKGEGNKNHPDTLNSFLQERLEHPPPLFRLTQSDYVTYQKTIKTKGHDVTTTHTGVDHILKFETLEEEFRALMQQYHLDDRIQLQVAHNNEAPVAKGSKKLGIEHLSNTTLRLIERHYAPDFALFNYTMIPPPYSAKAVSTLPKRIPKKLWMYWGQGWGVAAPEAIRSRRTFEITNPPSSGWDLHFINKTEAEAFSHRKDHIPDDVFHGLSVQAQSDVYRTLILHYSGGVWADASLQAAVPLDDWLSLDQPDLFTFLRFDNPQERLELNLDPWVTSWFLAAPARSYILSRVVDIISDPDHVDIFTKEYFWWHRTVAELAQTDTRVRRRLALFPSADAAHCMTLDFWRTAPFFKRCGPERMKELIVQHAQCCEGAAAVPPMDPFQAANCDEWDCGTLAPNNPTMADNEKIKGSLMYVGGSNRGF